MDKNAKSPAESAAILRFRRPGAPRALSRPLASPIAGTPPRLRSPAPVDDLNKYERQHDEPDDYRHRQITNAISFAILAALVVTGVWLAVAIADLRRDQDCVLSGRRNCAQIAIPGHASW